MEENGIAKNILLERMCDTCKHEFFSACRLRQYRPNELTCHLWEGFEMPRVVRLGYPNSMKNKMYTTEPIEIKVNMKFDCMED